MTTTSEEYRRMAKEAEDTAHEMGRKYPHRGLEDAYRAIAQQWLNLADQVERWRR